MQHRRVAFLAALLFVVPAAVPADDPPPPPPVDAAAPPAGTASEKADKDKKPEPVHEDVVVSATRSERSAADVPVSVTVIPLETLRTTPAHTLDDVLRDVPSIHVAPASSTLIIPVSGDFSMRGVSGNRALLMLDGAPVNDPWDGDVNWGRISRAAIERVEVARGGAASLFGNYAMSGTVGVFDLPADERRVWADAGYGSYGTKRLDAMATEPITDRLGIGITADTFDSDGFQRLQSGRGKIDIPFSASNRLFGARADGKLDDDTDYFVRANHFDTFISQGSPDAHDDKKGVEGGAGIRFRNALGGEVTANVFAIHQVFDTDNSSLVPGQGRDAEFLSNSHSNPSQRVGGSLQWSRSPSASVPFVTAGIDAAQVIGEDRIDSFSGNGTFTGQERAGGHQQFGGVFAEADYYPTSSLEVLASARLDLWRNYDGHDYSVAAATTFAQKSTAQFDPRLSLRQDLGGGWAVRAAGYRGFGAPTLDVLYERTTTKTSNTIPNPDLDPEHLIGYEAGVEYARGDFNVQANLFENRVSDLISTVNLPPTGGLRNRERVNVGKTRSRGVELFGDGRIGDRWRASAGYTFTDPRVIDNASDPTLVGRRVEKIPESVATGSLTYLHPSGWTATVRGRYFSDAFQDTANTMRLDAAAIFDAMITVPLGPAFDLTLTGENLLDRRYISDASQGPRIGAPAMYFVGIRIHPFPPAPRPSRKSA